MPYIKLSTQTKYATILATFLNLHNAFNWQNDTQIIPQTDQSNHEIDLTFKLVSE